MYYNVQKEAKNINFKLKLSIANVTCSIKGKEVTGQRHQAWWSQVQMHHNWETDSRTSFVLDGSVVPMNSHTTCTKMAVKR